MEYFIVTNDGRVNYDNKHTMMGITPYYRNVECTVVSDITETKKSLIKMKNKILFEDFVNLLKTIILEYTYPMKKDVKGYGKGDFQKAGQWGLSNNKIYDEEGKEVEDKKDGFVYRNIPGVKYPFETKENSTQFGEFDKDDAIANEIINRLMFGGEKKKPLYLFFNGVVRMIHEGLAGEKNYKMLSDICIYLSENPTLLLKDKKFRPV